MDDARKQHITELAKRSHAADQVVKAIGMQNTSGRTAEELKQQSVDYALAQAEAAEAAGLLRAAIAS